MRSRALQLVLIGVATAAIAGAAVFINFSEQHIATNRSAERAFDAVVRELTVSVAEFRSDGVAKSMEALRSMAATEKARASLEQAAAKASDFTEIAAVLDRVNAARVAEQEGADEEEAAQRNLEAAALAGAAFVALAALIGMVFAVPAAAAPASEPSTSVPAVETATTASPSDLPLRAEPSAPATGYMTSRPAGPVLRAASQLCTDLGRVSDIEELRNLVGRAAELMDASGLIVWMSGPEGTQLLPTLSHGYAADMISRLPALAKSADNAAAMAFRTAQLQLVLARPGESNGAIVAPVLSSAGCIGVISAEIRGGGETSESVQALAAIFAAQLAAVLHTTPAAHEARAATGTDNT